MSKEIDVNKIDDDQKRRAEHLKDSLQDKGMGQDQAKKEAIRTVAGEVNTGGKNAAGEPKKGAEHRGNRGEEGDSPHK